MRTRSLAIFFTAMILMAQLAIPSTLRSREEMRWLDPKRALYVTRTSPMGYNFAAVNTPMAGTLDYTDMRQHILAKGK